MFDTPAVFKMIILGQQGVGKSSMLIKYIKGEFSQHYNVTVGVEFASKEIQVENGKSACLQIWDTAGQETFRAVVRSFYKGISGVFLAFALDSEESLEAVKVWHKQVRENAHQQVMFFLVGTRADLQQQRQVSVQRAQQTLMELGAVFFIQTSAKTGLNINQLFQKSGQVMYKKYMINSIYREISSPTRLRNTLPMGNRVTISKAMSMEKNQKGRCCNK